MLLNDPEDPVFHDLDQFFRELGHNLVELALRSKNGNTSVHVVLHSPEGIGIDELSKAHKLLIPRLETLLQTEEISVEVGSPGLQRNLKYRRELAFYQGKKIKLYLSGGSDWEDGVIASCDKESITFASLDGPRTIPMGAIQKAKLNDL